MDEPAMRELWPSSFDFHVTFEPHTIFPEQFRAFNLKAHVSPPLQRLAVAVIEDALRSLKRKGMSRRIVVEQYRDASWIFEGSGRLPFDWCCALLDIDANDLRRRVRRRFPWASAQR